MRAKCIKADKFGRLEVGKVYDLVEEPFVFIVWDGGNMVCSVSNEYFKEYFEWIKERKFNVGDSVVYDSCKGRVVEINNYAYLLDTGVSIPLYHECNARLWNINDAKDGDVLTDGCLTVIFKAFEEPAYRERIIAYAGIDITGDLQITNGWWKLKNTYPATREQFLFLLEKLLEAGYAWDADQKKLSKISHNQSDQANKDFESKVSKELFKVLQNPKAFESDPDSYLKQVTQELFVLARKQLEADPKFLYSFTRKAAEAGRKSALKEVCQYLQSLSKGRNHEENRVH